MKLSVNIMQQEGTFKSPTTVVILYYHREGKLPYCPRYIAKGRTLEKHFLGTVSNKACIVAPCLVVT
jgi:hypothetical protein